MRPPYSLVTILACTLLGGCYLRHGFSDPAPDAGRRDGGWDAGADAGTDAGTDGGPPGIPDGAVAVTRPCERGTPAPRPGGGAPLGCTVRGPGDHDGDGFDNAVDCDDCSPQINPGAYDFPGNRIDEDCDGADARPCDDSGLPIEPGSALDAARAIGLCQQTTEGETSWGVLSARFTTADGRGEPASSMQVGILPSLGVNEPYDGRSMLALSTSLALDPPSGNSYCRNHRLRGGFPPGFPVDAPACPGVTSGAPWDPVALEIRMRVPTNARGLQFASAFFTHEYPDFICSPFNDVFAVFQERSTGFENIVFDAAGNPVTVNNALLNACRRGTYGEREFRCPLGTASLRETGYDVGCPFIGRPTRAEAGASTGCIQTLSLTEPGSIITLRFAIWDSGDGELDSLALIDAFSWLPQDVEIVEP